MVVPRKPRSGESVSQCDVGPVNRAGAVPAARPLRRRSGMKTVLVIDDDAEFRLPLSVFLRQHGWEVVETSDGDTGLALARQHLPRVILCDLLMPGTNGFRVCETIRGERALRYSLLIAMSGRTFEDTRQTAL